MGEKLPLIYVRGFAGGQRGIDQAADDPFYGFNEGSTHIRVGRGGQPAFYQFEGPLLRLMAEGYRPLLRGDQRRLLVNAPEQSLDPASIWVYRFYDGSASTFGDKSPEPYDIGRAARGLADFIALVRSKTRGRPRVNLVAHSMGGLICRAALQRHLADPVASVSKLCTIGTPHGGIDPSIGGGVGDWLMKTLDPNGAAIFHPDVMKTYLLPEGYDASRVPDRPDGRWDARTMVGSFPTSRVLSIVGTNARDYDIALGLSSRAIGEQSDGLVAIKDAYVKGSPRAYVHRAHSGRYGLVNSEETYQNLRRFLLGTLRVEMEIDGLDVNRLGSRVWQADLSVAIRELPVLIHDQSAERWCPVDLNAAARNRPTSLAPVPLVTMFLAPDPEKETCRSAINLRVISLEQRDGWFRFDDHLEQIADWQDSLVFDLRIAYEGEKTGDVTGGAAAWNSDLPQRIADAELPVPLTWSEREPGVWVGSVALPETARAMLGDAARISYTVRRWD
jgi:pimeloyl-ACP methyl ester carboxylesterase